MHIEFTPYMHVERLGTDEVDGILNGKVSVTTKVDGTSAVIFSDNGVIKVGSRKRIITPENDNQGCAKWVLEQDCYKKYFEKYPNHVLYGEFLIKNHIKDYESTAYKKVYLFDVFDVETKKWLPYEEWTKYVEEFDILYIPQIALLDNPTEQDIYNLLDKTTFLHNGIAGEGCVCKRYDFKNKWGRTIWAKVVRGEYLRQKHTKPEKMSNQLEKMPNQLEHDIVEKYITEDFVEKEYCKIVNDMGGWSSKYIGRLLGSIYHTFIVEESWNFVKTFHNPVIDFSVLNKLVVEKVKDIKKDVF